MQHLVLVLKKKLFLFVIDAWTSKLDCFDLESISQNIFGVNLHTLFESYIFSQHRKIIVTLIQWSSLQKSMSKLMPKKFIRLTPGKYLSIKLVLNP